MLHTVIFIGRSGCGKGTQAELFKEWMRKRDPKKRHILHVETGDRFRRFIREGGYSSDFSREIYESDERQPDFLACHMWTEMLLEQLEDDMHLVFDGAARALDEAQVLATAMRFYKRENVTVFYLDVSKRWSEDRLLARRRMDDRGIQKIDKRLAWFESDSIPAIEYMKSEPLYHVIEINGEQSIDEVHAEIIEKYENRESR